MRYPKNKLRPPPAGYLRWRTKKDKTGRALQNKQKLETKKRKIANKFRNYNRAQARLLK